MTIPSNKSIFPDEFTKSRSIELDKEGQLVSSKGMHRLVIWIRTLLNKLSGGRIPVNPALDQVIEKVNEVFSNKTFSELEPEQKAGFKKLFRISKTQGASKTIDLTIDPKATFELLAECKKQFDEATTTSAIQTALQNLTTTARVLINVKDEKLRSLFQNGFGEIFFDSSIKGINQDSIKKSLEKLTVGFLETSNYHFDILCNLITEFHNARGDTDNYIPTEDIQFAKEIFKYHKDTEVTSRFNAIFPDPDINKTNTSSAQDIETQLRALASDMDLALLESRLEDVFFEDAVRGADSILQEGSIEKNLDTLFDKKFIPKNYETVFKKVILKNIKFKTEIIEDMPVLQAQDGTNPATVINFSNRTATSELRAQNLKIKIEDLQKTNPEMTLYEALEKLCSDPFGSNFVYYTHAAKAQYTFLNDSLLKRFFTKLYEELKKPDQTLYKDNQVSIDLARRLFRSLPPASIDTEGKRSPDKAADSTLERVEQAKQNIFSSPELPNAAKKTDPFQAPIPEIKNLDELLEWFEKST